MSCSDQKRKRINESFLFLTEKDFFSHFIPEEPKLVPITRSVYIKSESKAGRVWWVGGLIIGQAPGTLPRRRRAR